MEKHNKNEELIKDIDNKNEEINVENNQFNVEIEETIIEEIFEDQDGNIEETLQVEETINLEEEFEDTTNNVILDGSETELTAVIKKDWNIGQTDKDIQKKKRQFKGTASTILLMMIIVFAIVSWFVSGQKYSLEDNTVEAVDKARYGLFDILRFLETGFLRDIGGIWFLIIASGAMGVFIRTGATQALMQKMKESNFFTPKISLIFVMAFISIITTMFNANYLLIAIAVFVVPLLVFSGYDIITALMAILFASAAGQMASVFNGELIIEWVEVMNNHFGIAAGETIAKEATAADGLVFRFIVFMLFTSSAITIVAGYGDKILADFSTSKSRRETSKFIQTGSVIFGNKGKENMTTRKKVVLYSFLFTILISLIGVLRWEELGINFFFDLTSSWSDDGHPMRIIWGTSMNPLGRWGYLEISYMFILLSLIVGFASFIPQRKYIQGMTRGINTSLNIILILTLSGALFTMIEESGLHYTIFYSTLSTFQGWFGNAGVPIGAFFSSMAFSLAFPMTQDLMVIIADIMPRIIVDMNGPSFEFIMFVGTAITIGAGLVSIILPTSAITIGLIWAYKIPYNKWLAATWKPVLMFAGVATPMVIAFTLLLGL